MIESRDNGKIIRETTAQAKSLQSYLDYFAGMADKIVGQQIPSPAPTSSCTPSGSRRRRRRDRAVELRRWHCSRGSSRHCWPPAALPWSSRPTSPR